MSLIILDNILHGQLKPWKSNTNNTNSIIESIRFAKSVNCSTNNDLLKHLSFLLKDFSLLLKHIDEETEAEVTMLTPTQWKANLPNAISPGAQYYLLLINAETLHIYNSFKQKAQKWSNEIDLKFHLGKLLNSIKVLALQTSTELKDRGFTDVSFENSEITHYVLYCLKQNLVALYMSIQEVYMPFVSSPTSIEDFFMLDLQEPFTDGQFEHEEYEIKNTTIKKFSFGFKGDHAALKTVLTQLTIKVDLVNEKLNKVDELYHLLTAKEIIPGAVEINIGCETVEFQYIAQGLKTVIKKFTPANIGKSKSFKSKNCTVINAQLLYSSNIEEPKRKEEIDNILKYLKEKKH